MITLALAAFILVCLGLVILLFVTKDGQKFGILKSKVVYSDTEGQPGEVLFSKTLNLVGKPDYLIKENGLIFPVEIKTGKTPSSPYLNHTLQLMAYCLLVEENFGIKPVGGYLKYPEKEFKIAYTNEAKESVKLAVNEILRFKESGEELTCNHQQHN
jgi:CRISPR-associated exonuclease Cas4